MPRGEEAVLANAPATPACETRTGSASSRALHAAVIALRQAAANLGQWFRGATESHKYENYLRHAKTQPGRPLSELEFYLDDQRRKYSRPNRCC